MILVGLVLGILLLTPHVRWDALFPNPEIRWAEIVRLLDEKKWDRVVRELERFEEDFLESPRVGETSFFAAQRQPSGSLAGHFALILERRSPKAGSPHRAIPRSILAAGGLGAEKLEAPRGGRKLPCGEALTWYARTR